MSFVVQCDASDFGLGAVLTQTYNDEEHVVCYLSRSLSKNEHNYSTTEKECLAVIFAIERLRPYLERTKFTVITDHYSLKWLNSIKDPVGRIARWALRLQQYNFEIVHRRGRKNVMYVISKVLSPWAYELEDANGRNIGVWHAKDHKAHPPEACGD